MKLVVGITGASGIRLAVRFLDLLPQDIETFVVLSDNAKKALPYESDLPLPDSKRFTYFDDTKIEACISSGSFKTDAMIILPCSMNTLAKCSVGIADTLITRAFSVMLKEKRDVVLAPREMPLNAIHLENMTKLANLGVTIAPPTFGYYSEQKSLEEMERFIIGKWFDILKIDHNLFKRWGENE
jgi:4-hydroxy-3-polyprenylbenzoate decarboxylase